MRILLSYPSEAELGEGVHFRNVLRRMGHETIEINVAVDSSRVDGAGRVVRGYPPTVSLTQLLREHGKVDLYLYIEPMGLIPRDLESSPIPTACVICDCHRNLKPRQTLARLFDHVFLYQKNYLTSFVDHPKEAVYWLPYACDTEFFRDLRVPRDIDVAFIGKLMGPSSDRRRAIELLSQKYRLNDQRYYTQDEIPRIYSRAKMVLNIPLADDLNFRFFEALSSGALLLTKRIRNGQEELFDEGADYVAFTTPDEMLAKVDHYLNNQAAREQIAASGYAKVRASHTLEIRVQRLLELIQKGPRFAAPVRQLSSAQVLALYTSVYERAGQVEALLRLAAERPDGLIRKIPILFAGLKSFARRATLSW